ncbi:MAG TPA: hypothetical protein GXX51_07605 [Firmicutes bacterium]|nr:hypothetical protein [Bacillota bacterium]
MDVVILTNSPGEVTGWVRPVVERLVERDANSRVFVFLSPCVFASRREAQVLREIPGISGVFSPREYIGYALFGRRPAGFAPAGPGVVVHLGGDFMHSARVAKRLGFPAVAYSDRTASFHGSFKVIAVEDNRVRDKLIAKGIPPGKLRVIGNLMVDSVKPSFPRDLARQAFGIREDAFCVLIMPGSRPQQVKHMAPFFLEVAGLIKKVERRAEFLLALSPFVSREMFEAAVGEAAVEFGGRSGEEDAAQDAAREHTGDAEMAGKTRVHIVEPDKRYDAMAASDLAIVMPGTSTAELGFLGIPMVVAVPLNWPGEVPLPGILGLAGGVPVLGGLLKRYAIRGLINKVEFTALPNKRARKMIVPEVRGVLDPEDVAIQALELLQDASRRMTISKNLIEAMGAAGAANRLVDIIFEAAGGGGDRCWQVDSDPQGGPERA